MEEVSDHAFASSTNDLEVVEGMEAVTNLRMELASRWINTKRLKTLLDINLDGKISFDEFYDGLSQFGITKQLNVKEIFNFLDKDGKGEIPVDELVKSMELTQCDVDKQKVELLGEEVSEEKIQDLGSFPETLLVALVAHNHMKVS